MKTRWYRPFLVPTVSVGTHTGCSAPDGLQPRLYAFPFMPFRVRGSVGTRSRGFTLLEMLLVIFLMALVASTGLMLTEGVEDQSKYDETKRRMELIRKAIVGDPTRTVNGGPEISGFVADMGRLPECLVELLALGDEILPATNPRTFKSPCDDTVTITEWNLDTNSGLGGGWRGPYVQTLPDADGLKRFRDGYENDDGSVNFGWQFSDATSEIRVQSAGTNGVFDGITPSDDYPAGNTIADVPALISTSDQDVNFQGWDAITIRFENNSASGVPVSIPANALRLALSYADDSQPDGINEFDSDPFPASAISVPSASIMGSVNVLNGTTLTVPTGTTLSGTTLTFNTTGNLTFTSGITVTVVAGNTALVPTGSSLGGTTLTIGSNGTLTFLEGSVISVTTNYPSLPSVMGHFSLMVVCNDPANPNAVDGKRFDGNCGSYGDDANPLTHIPSNQPYLFSAPPRSMPVLPPSPLNWSIQ